MATTEHKPTQNEMILAYMKEYGSITRLDAFMDLGIMALNSRISDLRQLGYPIESKMITVFNRRGEKCRVSEYSLGSESNG